MGKIIRNGVFYSGGSGIDDYNTISNKPQINGVALTGNKTSSDLKLDGVFVSAETVVGEWDGKPLYRKCFSADNVNISSTTVLDASLTPTAVTPTKIDSTYKFGDAWYDGTFYFAGDTGYTAYTRVDSSGARMVVTNRTVQGYRITIYYTKNAE